MLMPYSALANTPEEVSKQALDMAGDQNFDEALSLINTQEPEIRDSYDLRFTRARILAWAQNYNASDLAYKALLRDYPGNPDILNAYGYLDYYRGNYDEADQKFNQVLADYPGYADASSGLQRTKDARADARRSKQTWRIDVGGETSSFNNGQADWNNQTIRAEYVPGDLAMSLSAAHYRRFGLDDLQLMAGLRSSNNSDWDWEIGAGFTPSADFRASVTGLGRVGGPRPR